MFAPTNSENETRRAQSILRSFTEYEAAVNLFDSDQNYDQFELVERTPKGKHTMQALKAVKPNRQTSEQPAFSPS